MGKVTYKPYIAQNIVIEQKVSGKVFKSEYESVFEDGVYIPQGTKIDLVVSKEMGEVESPVPNLIGLSLEEGAAIIKGSELFIGVIQYDFNSSKEVGTILRQTPSPYFGRLKPGVKAGSAQDERKRQMILAGQVIDLWVAGDPDSNQ